MMLESYICFGREREFIYLSGFVLVTLEALIKKIISVIGIASYIVFGTYFTN